MPRARTQTTEDVVTDAPKKRAPRKRVVKNEDEDEVALKPKTRAPRKRLVEENRTEEDVSEARVSTRRAPTPIQTNKITRSRSRRGLMVAVAIFMLISGIGIVIGVSDHGQIDVVAVVNERNERVNRGEVREGESTITVPVQNNDTRPNGGLVPADVTIPEPSPVVEDTATSSVDGVASSSLEAVIDPEVVEETKPVESV